MRGKRRGAAPSTPIPDTCTIAKYILKSPYELVKAILTEVSDKYSAVIDNKPLQGLWQAVPMYSRDVSFLPVGYTKDSQYYCLRSDNPIELTVKKYAGRKELVITTMRTTGITFEKTVAYSSTPRVITKMRNLKLNLVRHKEATPLSFNGTIK